MKTNYRRKIIGVFFLLTCWASASTGPGVAAQSAIQDGAATAAALPPVACRFQSAIKEGKKPPQQFEWYLWRRDEMVEKREPQINAGEIWLRNRNGQVTYRRVFHREKIVIEYFPGDLRALGFAADWPSVAQVVNPQFLLRLSIKGRKKLFGQEAQLYKGEIDGAKFEIWWLTKDLTPALIIQKRPDREVTVKLTEIYPLDKTPWPFSQNQDYRIIDFADLGEKNADPELRRLLGIRLHKH